MARALRTLAAHMTATDTLGAALVRIMAGVGRIEKSATAPATMGGFRFVPVTAVMTALQPLLVAEGVALLPRVELLRLDPYTFSGGKAGSMATVRVQLYAQRGAEQLLWAEGIASGVDTTDKAAGKATTGAVKQALLNALAVPTGDDPDAGAAGVEGTGLVVDMGAAASPAQAEQVGAMQGRLAELMAAHNVSHNLVDAMARGLGIERGKATPAQLSRLLEQLTARYEGKQ